MKITDISLQARDKNRVNVSVDGKYRFSLDVLQVGELGLRVGREYTEEELQQLEDESQFGKLYTRALEYCLVRPRAVREMRDYLWRKTRPTKRRSPKTGEIIERPGVSLVITERVIERLIAKGYLDDAKFARFWFEYRFAQKGASVRRLRLELTQKGISREVIDELVAAEIRSDEDELAKIIAKKQRKYPDRQKFMAYLARQGFSYDDIVTALEQRDE